MRRPFCLDKKSKKHHYSVVKGNSIDDEFLFVLKWADWWNDGAWVISDLMWESKIQWERTKKIKTPQHPQFHICLHLQTCYICQIKIAMYFFESWLIQAVKTNDWRCMILISRKVFSGNRDIKNECRISLKKSFS